MVKTPALSPTVRHVVDAALSGRRLEPRDVLPLARAAGDELAALMEAAAALRDGGKGRTVTYSRKVFIPLTNLCRQKCGYCTFARSPNDPLAHTMSPDEVLAVARAGRHLACREALFSLGEAPEEVHEAARRDLARVGHTSTISYLRAMCELVLDRTGLLPHANPGVMTRDDIAALRDVTASMGIMLETVSDRLTRPGGPHYNCPGKAPAARLDTIRFAGELAVPFTTGILIGIGETEEERVESLFAIRELHERYGHIQEVIIQNFRVKDDIAFRHHDEPSVEEMLRTIALARVILGPEMNVQAPPNLTPAEYGRYLAAGLNDWGGVSPLTRDHINPERPWPKIAELADVSAAAGFELRERLAVYPEFMEDRFLAERVRSKVHALAGEDGLVPREEQRW